ncbi:MAG: hypothetical protein IJH34_09025 [Romboutsia sp.]|nr:hypothetical protein [Romboutsia sp.]
MKNDFNRYLKSVNHRVDIIRYLRGEEQDEAILRDILANLKSSAITEYEVHIFISELITIHLENANVDVLYTFFRILNEVFEYNLDVDKYVYMSMLYIEYPKIPKKLGGSDISSLSEIFNDNDFIGSCNPRLLVSFSSLYLEVLLNSGTDYEEMAKISGILRSTHLTMMKDEEKLVQELSLNL